MNRYGLLNFNILVTKKDAANIEAIPASESTLIKHPSTMSGLFTQGHTTHSFSSKSVAQQKEEAKFIALKRIYLNSETQIRAFVGTRFSVDDHTTSTSCIMRLPSSLRDLPAFSLENMPSFVTMRFSHIRGVKSAWHIDLMTSADSGPFRSTTGVFHAVINLKLAFQLIFQDLITNEPNRLIDLALAQWERLLLNQDAFTSFKHLRLDFIVDELMMSLCKMAQMFNDPRLDGIIDKTAASALLAEATRVDEADIMRKGTMLLLTDQKREKSGKPLAIAPPKKSSARISQEQAVEAESLSLEPHRRLHLPLLLKVESSLSPASTTFNTSSSAHHTTLVATKGKHANSNMGLFQPYSIRRPTKPLS